METMADSIRRIYSDRVDEQFDIEIHSHESRCGDIKWIDIVTNEQPTPSLFGGVIKSKTKKTTKTTKKTTKRVTDEKPIYRSLIDVPDKDIQDFIHKFKLGYIAVTPKSNAIFIIPNSTAMKVLEADLAEKVKSPDSPEGIEAIKNGDLLYKQYIMDVYGSGDNEGFEYRIPSSFPDEIDNVIRRRQNRAGTAFYVKLAKNSIEIAEDADMTKPVTCKFRMRVGRDSNSCAYIFEGNLTFDSSKKQVKKTTNKSKFAKLITLNHNDTQLAAHHFIGFMAKKYGVDKCQPFYSADLVHTAMSLINNFDDNESNDIYIDDEELEAISDELARNYKPINRPFKSYSKICAVMSAFNESCMSNDLSQNEYIDKLNSQYKALSKKIGSEYNSSDLVADVGYGVFQQTNDLSVAVDAMTSMNELLGGGDINPLMYYAIVEAINEFAFTGVNSRQYLPTTFGLRKRTTVKKPKVKSPKSKKTKHDIDDTTDLEFPDGDDFDIESYL